MSGPKLGSFDEDMLLHDMGIDFMGNLITRELRDDDYQSEDPDDDGYEYHGIPNMD